MFSCTRVEERAADTDTSVERNVNVYAALSRESECDRDRGANGDDDSKQAYFAAKGFTVKYPGGATRRARWSRSRVRSACWDLGARISAWYIRVRRERYSSFDRR